MHRACQNQRNWDVCSQTTRKRLQHRSHRRHFCFSWESWGSTYSTHLSWDDEHVQYLKDSPGWSTSRRPESVNKHPYSKGPGIHIIFRERQGTFARYHHKGWWWSWTEQIYSALQGREKANKREVGNDPRHILEDCTLKKVESSSDELNRRSRPIITGMKELRRAHLQGRKEQA